MFNTDDNPKKNAEGYTDLTAYNAIENIEREVERHQKLVGCILRICELSGFYLEERLVLRDKRTGKIWR